MLEGRDYVTPEDVKAVAVPALAHRLTLAPELWLQQLRGDEVVAELLEQVPTPPPRTWRRCPTRSRPPSVTRFATPRLGPRCG